MNKFYIVALAFAAIFAINLLAASDATALTLWDQCTKTAPVLEFTESDCIEKGGSPTWGWEEIKTLQSGISLPTLIFLGIPPIVVHCSVIVHLDFAAGGLGQIVKFLSAREEEITETKPAECKVTSGLSFCTEPTLVSPDNLPWSTELVAAGDLLLSSGVGNPGWLVTCANGAENLCEKAERLLTVENLASELEVMLTFAKEKGTCTNILAKEWEIEGTISSSLENGNALQAM